MVFQHPEETAFTSSSKALRAVRNVWANRTTQNSSNDRARQPLHCTIYPLSHNLCAAARCHHARAPCRNFNRTSSIDLLPYRSRLIGTVRSESHAGRVEVREHRGWCVLPGVKNTHLCMQTTIPGPRKRWNILLGTFMVELPTAFVRDFQFGIFCGRSSEV